MFNYHIFSPYLKTKYYYNISTARMKQFYYEKAVQNEKKQG